MPDRIHPLRRLWRYAGDHRAQTVRASAFSILNKLFDLAPPLLIGAAVDLVVNREESLLADLGIEDPRDQVVVLALITFAVWALESLFEYLFSLDWRNLAQTVQHDLRLDAYEHVQGLELGYFEEESTGQLMSILNDDVNQLERFLDHGANDIWQVTVTVVVIGATYAMFAPDIAFWAFLPMPVIIIGSVWFQKKLEPRYAVVRERVGQLNTLLANNLGGIGTIKAFATEKREVERVEAASEKYRQANRDAIRLSSAFVPLIRIAILVSFTAAMVLGGLRTLDGGLAVGAYSVMIYMTQRLLWPLTRLGQTLDLYQRAMASTNRVLDVLERPPRMTDGDRPLDVAQVEGGIEFDQVVFGYAKEPLPVIDDLTFVIEPGTEVALVGNTGAGKTTVIKLLLRFYDPVGGEIRIDGRPLHTLRTRDLRRAVALVSQDVFLFDGTIRENIRYGRPEATNEDVIAAARNAEADEFVERFLEGYDTVVGERGQKLSGGQRQRLSLARAILKDAPVLILDEATSAVDNETEAAIQRSLARVREDRTVIVIAHRLSTVRHADQILVVDDGKIVESGTHDELVAASGRYARLWAVQTGTAVSH